MTTETATNGTQGDTTINPGTTPSATPAPTLRSTPRSTPKSTRGSTTDTSPQRSISVDVDVADRITELSRLVDRRISAIVALGEVLARRHLADEFKVSDAEWVEQMAAR
jgi:hypothetical protein